MQYNKNYIIRVADYHMEVLAKHCRICAKPLARFKVSYRWGDRFEA